MAVETGTIRLSIHEEYDDAVRSVRHALENRGMRIALELDVAGRVERTLGIRLLPCRILYIWPDFCLAGPLSAAAAVILPLHVVVSSAGSQTDVCMAGGVRVEGEGIGERIRTAVARAQSQVLECLETIAMRPSLV